MALSTKRDSTQDKCIMANIKRCIMVMHKSYNPQWQHWVSMSTLQLLCFRLEPLEWLQPPTAFFFIVVRATVKLELPVEWMCWQWHLDTLLLLRLSSPSTLVHKVSSCLFQERLQSLVIMTESVWLTVEVFYGVFFLFVFLYGSSDSTSSVIDCVLALIGSVQVGSITARVETESFQILFFNMMMGVTIYSTNAGISEFHFMAHRWLEVFSHCLNTDKGL